MHAVLHHERIGFNIHGITVVFAMQTVVSNGTLRVLRVVYIHHALEQTHRQATALQAVCCDSRRQLAVVTDENTALLRLYKRDQAGRLRALRALIDEDEVEGTVLER
jgi:hypothetical protein